MRSERPVKTKSVDKDPIRGDSFIAIADLHIGDTQDAQDFAAFLDGQCSPGTCLFILGDLFQLWVGKEGLETHVHQEVLRHLGELRSSGCRLFYVEGNRDFGIMRRHGELFERVSQEELSFETVDGQRYLLAHGDLVNREDRQYRLWRRMARGPLSFLLLHVLPSALARSIANWMEEKLRHTNLRHKRGFPVAQAEDFGRYQLERGYDAVVLGHFHEERIIDIHGADRTGTLYALGFWKEEGRFLRVRSSGEVALKRYSS